MERKSDVLLQADHMRKEFGITKAVKDIDLTIYRGEVRTLIGENGSGKSTLSNMFAGVYMPTEGTMTLRGEPYKPENIIDARMKGIGLVVQEVGTIDGLTVAENMFMGREKRFCSCGLVNRRKMMEAADKALADNGIDHFHGADLIDKLTFEDRKLVEVIMVMEADPDIMIFDESTTALSRKGRDLIYKIMEMQKKKGKSIIFISHDLDEVTMVSDRVTVMRDGDYIATLEKEEITPERMRNLMIGRELTDNYYRTDYECTCGDVVLQVKDLTKEGMFEDVSFDIHEGEIVGIGGLTECGMHELCKAVFGIYSVDKGEIYHVGAGRKIKSTLDALESKMGYLSKNREVEAMMPSASIRDNIMLTCYDKAKKGMILSPRKEKEITRQQKDKLSIKCRDMEQWGRELSGGNKQKVVIAKWLANDSEILIMDCPTRGIDIGVKAAIYELMNELKKQKKAIIMVSEELPELIGMSDVIYIMKDGKITGSFQRNEMVTEHDVIKHMI
ncbi:MAG: sugar ABC transporter ATP-binding protein [Lachnospiraceae bacterium]|jgi:ribose transport system ATP-binding protein|nr:hypothetical protein C819_03336 [Lachnospiraceae bacterium 10-1]MCX4351339.1 sugar ABC transporter ATP-binding protein [Lachnospiraceae bacterium]